ncbi:MAG: hypothetical protein COX79_01765 [Candidatus Levybacteria bacterium CG_4_10_14_0_2_um_filter_36_16]|nr:MAG: hypothetical protein AUK12_00325 [Candidatus Levybacteria bacterium CG2_30_37_29]PIR79275.1 MAG: hypothetical protein COU26_01970 [Candidatus Levybacteria bacterium CG10_big_fil_rev_8_21_14_0_10_36_30]PIZ97560.1 MAG: hypothetical protein COX79_01765 [Candidatus Levybacteria bacterium CG_4_10_14_0_2_um_filter_36_16]PJA90088.1 MAG: hypothetical protein CO136_03110 [Candidatus Levybacteria bacterium CG_4_9_14_3_um_filter_36_7]
MTKLTPDERWKRFNQKLNEQMKANDFYSLGITYQEMANFLDKEGKNSEEMRNKAYEMKLLHHQNYIKNLQNNSPVSKGVEILSAPDSCESCLALDSKAFEFKKVLDSPPLPVKECKHIYGCRCTYLPVAN